MASRCTVVILFLTHLQGRGGLIQWTQFHTVIRIYDSFATPLAQLLIVVQHNNLQCFLYWGAPQ